MSYHDIIFMPVKRFFDLVKWKSELENERKKILKEQENEIKRSSKRK